MVAGLLCVLCALLVALCFNIRKKQKARAVSITALQARTAAHAQQIEAVGRAVAGLVPPDARPTAPHAAAAVDHGRDRLPPPPPVPRAFPSFSTDKAPPSPHRSAEAVQRQITEIAGAPGEPVETEGDRGGVNPGDAPELGRLPGESREDWGARLDLLDLQRRRAEQAEAEEIRERFQRIADGQDTRDAEHAAPPGEDDRTLVTAVPQRDPLAGVALERPTSSATRTAEAFERAHPRAEGG
jgi:hypothetical protein